LGFSAALDAELKVVGELTADGFQDRYAPPEYLERPTWDPTTAKFWGRLMSDPGAAADEAEKLTSHPAEQVAQLRSTRRDQTPIDLRLSDDEVALYRNNGFVVSERLGSHSFTDLYYRVYVRDLPVFVTADSLLHAWHRQFDRLLEDLETQEIQPLVSSLLDAAAARLPEAQTEYGSATLAASARDVDFVLCVARRLLEPKRPAPTAFDQEPRVQAALEACDRLGTEEFELFGKRRLIDFSQFKPRGRYDQSELAKQYFRGVMWLSRMDFRFGASGDGEQELRELGAAVVLHDLLSRSGGLQQWRELDRLLTLFVGQTDCLNLAQLDSALRSLGVGSAADMTDESLAELHEQLQTSRLGTQEIRGEVFCIDPSDPKKFVLPRSFALMGQRFTLDSWALAKVVYDDVIWEGKKVQRRVPSSLDVSFAALGNNHVTPRLHKRMTNQNGRKFRDGFPYQHQLAAVRNVIDALPRDAWDASLYTQWLGCLRELSTPTTDPTYPEAVRTSAWAQKTTATQLASWTQLRHDTVLYAKPSYSSGNTCYYPAGYVEPVPHFWRRFDEMVRSAAGYFENLPLPERGDKYVHGQRRSRKLWTEHLQRFAAASGMLRAIAEKQAARTELSNEETEFLQQIVVRSGMCGAPPISGWYPQLFARRGDMTDDAQKWTALVTDVHTDPSDPLVGDPGCVLHEGVGNVEFLVIAIDNGEDRVMYAGPVFSHYEFEAPVDQRLTNDEWQDRLRRGEAPPREEGAASYLAPGTNPDVANYGLQEAEIERRWGAAR
jgi:hypothetical protein